jgi:hypothetical protein
VRLIFRALRGAPQTASTLPYLQNVISGALATAEQIALQQTNPWTRSRRAFFDRRICRKDLNSRAADLWLT